MNLMIEPWHWFVLGILLILSELIITTMALFWCGIAAIMVSILYWLMPWLSLSMQFIVWSIFSIVCTLLWFKYLKPLKEKSKKNLGTAIGQIGMVVDIQPQQHFKVRFSVPVLQQDEWICLSNTALKVGDRVQITEIKNHQFMIQPYTSKEV